MHQLNDRQAQIIIQVLQKNQEAFGQLQHILEQEQTCLKENNRQLLEKIVQEKSLSLKAAQQAEQQLVTLLSQLKCPLEKKAVERLLANTSSNFKTILSNQWARLHQSMLKCERLNQVNGKVISRIRMGLASVVSSLKGQDPASQIYQASGITHTQGGTRLIAQA
jgi:flagella synthesis protein FlgN